MITTSLLNVPEGKGFGEKLQLVATSESPTCKFDIFEITSLEGSLDLHTTSNLFFARQQGLRAKLCRVTLNNGGVVLEAGALYMRMGQIDARSALSGPGNRGPSLMGLVNNAVKSAVTKESFIKPEYWGTGELWLEPVFDHFLLLNINENWGPVICDRGMFFACEPGIHVTAEANLNSGGLGGDGIFQTKLMGTGNILLRCPVPSSEIMVVKLNNDTLQVDGNFALLRAGNIRYTLQRSMNSLAGSLISGEGLLQTFQGTGMVYLAPTQKIYSYVNAGTTDLPIGSNTRV